MNTFRNCSYCHFTGNDICEFKMWQKCDAQDRPIPDSMMITCKQAACLQKINEDPMLFIEVPWSRGGPGKFILICADGRMKPAGDHPATSCVGWKEAKK